MLCLWLVRVTNTNYLSSTLNASLILVDSLALVVRDGAALLAVLRLALLLRHGDALLLALGVSSPAVLARPGGGQGTLENMNLYRLTYRLYINFYQWKLH